MRISAQYCLLRPMAIQKKRLLINLPEFLFSVQRSQFVFHAKKYPLYPFFGIGFVGDRVIFLVD
jgi:hypothetical protein